MYQAIIARVKTRPHPDPEVNRIQLGEICGETVVIGLDVKDNQLMVYFASDGQLSHEFCAANNLYSHPEKNWDPTKKGYFGDNRRVRAQKFRGEKSDGFAIELDALHRLGSSVRRSDKEASTALWPAIQNLKDGDAFTELAGVPICNKYFTPATQRARAGKQGQKKKKKKKRVNVCFPEHRDTAQFRHRAGKIPAGSILTISEKLHGTSARYAFVLEEYKLPLTKTAITTNFCIHQLNRIPGINIPYLSPEREADWARLVGTRRVIKGEPGEDWHGSDNYRWDFMKDVWPLMRKGEIIYGEIVGYTDSGASIMKSQPTAKMDKKFRKQYDDVMTYKYGCPAGTSAFYVYRITASNEDGAVVELSPAQMKERARELGLEICPELVGPIIYMGQERGEWDEEMGPEPFGARRINKNICGIVDLNELRRCVDNFTEGPSTLDPSHIREGVVIRVDGPQGNTYFLKDKSHDFKVLEGIIKDDDSYVDTEEAEG
tara:strand:- start:10030 stop:11496 length:1467 start_codon:yes stop_codon:yes gene_type:complete